MPAEVPLLLPKTQITLAPEDAFIHALKLSLVCEDAYQAKDRSSDPHHSISQIYIRSFECDKNPFVDTTTTGIFYRVVDCIVFRATSYFSGKKVVPYNLEDNLDYLQALFEKMKEFQEEHVALEELPRSLRESLFTHFSGNPKHALKALVDKVKRMVERHTFDERRRRKLLDTLVATQETFRSISSFPVVVNGKIIAMKNSVAFTKELQNELEDIQGMQDEDRFDRCLKNFQKKIKKFKEALPKEFVFTTLQKVAEVKFTRLFKELSEPEPKRQITFENFSAHEESLQNIIEDFEHTYDRILDTFEDLEAGCESSEILKLDAAAGERKKELLAITKEKLEKYFVEMTEELTHKIESTTDFAGFYSAQETIRKYICDFIKIDEAIGHKDLYAIFCREIQALSEKVHAARFTKQQVLLQQEVLPQIELLLKQIDESKKEDADDLIERQKEIRGYLSFLEQAQSRLPGKSTTQDSSIELLGKVIALLRQADQKLRIKIYQYKGIRIEEAPQEKKQQDTSSSTQTLTSDGEGLRVLITNSPNSVVTIGGNEGTSLGGNDSFLSKVAQSILPTTGFASSILSYGPQVVLSAASIYLTGGASLTTAILSSLALSVVPTIVTNIVRSMLPRPIAPVMAPVIDFATRLLVLRYGTSFVTYFTNKSQSSSTPSSSQSTPVTTHTSQQVTTDQPTLKEQVVSALVPEVGKGMTEVLQGRVKKLAKSTKPLQIEIPQNNARPLSGRTVAPSLVSRVAAGAISLLTLQFLWNKQPRTQSI